MTSNSIGSGTTRTLKEVHGKSSSDLTLSCEKREYPYLADYLRLNPEAHCKDSKMVRPKIQRYFDTEAVCWVCLGPHKSTVCPEKRCFRCSQAGHSYDECRAEEFCINCRKYGHATLEACPLYVYCRSRNTALHAGLTCSVCSGKGHVQCDGSTKVDGVGRLVSSAAGKDMSTTSCRVEPVANHRYDYAGVVRPVNGRHQSLHQDLGIVSESQWLDGLTVGVAYNTGIYSDVCGKPKGCAPPSHQYRE